MTKSSSAVIFLIMLVLFGLSSCSKNQQKPAQVIQPTPPLIQKVIQPAPGEITVLAVNMQKDAPVTVQGILSGEDSILTLNIGNTENKNVKLKNLALIPSFKTLTRLDENEIGRIDAQANPFQFLYLLTLEQNGQAYKFNPVTNAGIVAVNVVKEVTSDQQTKNFAENTYKLILGNNSTRTIQMIAINNPLLKSMQVYRAEE